jgi:aspartyl-tRNA(Asn)/glutamyl-tRNA(Gln) amidotransferase subunit A
MAELWELPLTELVGQIKKKRLSPVSLVESLLARIDSLDPFLKAWVTIDRQRVLREAKQRQAAVSRKKSLGPLHGIPIGVKDIYYTAGMRTTAGSKIMADFIPEYDATAVERLKKAGAIILGKTATTEFAFADPAPTRNPWNPDHTPGGSSSGSAAAVAAGMCPAALGSQTGGSVLRPAAYCGLVGLKPTYGRISRYGVFPVSWSLDHLGVFTRSVKDAAVLLKVLAGHDPQDPTSSRESVADYPRFLKAPGKPPKIGLVQAFYRENAQEEVWRHTEDIAQQLQKAGARLEEVRMPGSFSAVQYAHAIIMRVEAASVHEKLYAKNPGQYPPKLSEVIEVGLLISGTDYLQAQKIKRRFRREMDSILEPFDCLLTPATSSAAPMGLSSTGNPWFQVPWSFSGLPTIGLPSGLNREGLPLAIQLVGKANREGELLKVARWCERVIPFALSPHLN